MLLAPKSPKSNPLVVVVFFLALVLLKDQGLLSPKPLSDTLGSFVFLGFSSALSVVEAAPMPPKSQVFPHVPKLPESFLDSLPPKLNSSFGAASSRLMSWKPDVGRSGAPLKASSMPCGSQHGVHERNRLQFIPFSYCSSSCPFSL